ncbi:MAG: tetratricopeptide repeat protein, partial [Cyanobacteria bacterium]|nr:tetratricopeptide repeat protein [Cyanobacteriota bacterium]
MRSSTICIGITTCWLAAGFFVQSTLPILAAESTESASDLAGAAKSAQVADLLKQAKRKEKSGQWPNAISLYRQAVRLDGTNPDCTGGLVECWRKVVKLAPDAVSNRLGLGEALELHEAFDEAETEYKYVLQLDPHNALAKKKLARLPDVRKSAGSRKLLNAGADLQESGQLDKAVEQYKLALNVSPEDPLVWLNLASCYQAMNKFDQSKSAYEKVLSLKDAPDDVRKSAEEGLGLISGEISAGDFNQAHQKAIDLFNAA